MSEFEAKSVEIVITLRDEAEGHVVIEEARKPGSGETEASVTVASALAEEMLALVETLGEAEVLPVKDSVDQ